MKNDDTNFNRIMSGLHEVLDIVEGRAQPAKVHVPAEIDVKAIRTNMGLTQAEFAARFGFSAAAVRDWEQRRRRPEATARVLLTVIAKEPEAVQRALEAA
ncbi:NadS family protein [Phenylobacterium koreense]|uniref:Transcriptional regulator n=1 Tax=Phenylobacterium koreense TaxID=266125 RepID=A0ABV2EII3_9CAUL